MFNTVQLAVCLNPSQTCSLDFYNPSTEQFQNESCLEGTCRMYSMCIIQWVPDQAHKKTQKLMSEIHDWKSVEHDKSSTSHEEGLFSEGGVESLFRISTIPSGSLVFQSSVAFGMAKKVIDDLWTSNRTKSHIQGCQTTTCIDLILRSTSSLQFVSTSRPVMLVGFVAPI